MGARTLAAALLAVGSLACDGVSEGPVERFEARLTLQPDGTLEVAETWLVDVDPGRSSTFIRRLPREHDGLSGVQTSPPARIDHGKSSSVTWTMGAGWDAGLQSLSVRYTAASALALGPGRARLSWPLLDPTHRWRIKQAYLHFEGPPGIAPIAPGGIAEPGWRVTEVQTGVQAIRSDIAPGDPVTVSFEFSRDALKLQEPRWQFLSERAREFMPAFASAAAFIVIVGLSVLGLLRVLVSEQGRAAAREGLRTAGIVFLLLGPALALVVRLTLDSFGPWAQSVPAAVAVVGLMFLVAGAVDRTQDRRPRTKDLG